MGTEDTRIALKEGTSLRFYNHDNSVVTYTIQKVIGRGGSVIVYNASYTDNAGCQNIVRIKECYPFYITLARDDAGALIIAEEDIPNFQKYQQGMLESYRVSKKLFYTSGLTNSISNTLDLYEANNTVYTVSTYVGGEVLSAETAGSVKECISIVKSVASTIRKLHEKGYLYLDLKPDNIFILEGITELVQLFDFDTIVPLEEINKPGGAGKYRIACTKGYAAYELQKGKFRLLGKHTDVYGVGALLFYLLFKRPPEAPDCEADAEYRFGSSRFAGQHYQDRLFQALPDFFHHSLVNCHIDRYPDMDQVIDKLTEIEKYADTVVPFVISSQVNCPTVLVGREAELEALEVWVERGETNCLFLTGMGGIGKSSVVKKYIADHRRNFDAVLYLYYEDSVRTMVTDDGQLRINSMERREEESVSDYFLRKVNMLMCLAAGKRMLLVIDNFEGAPDADFVSVLNTGCKVIAVTRNDIPETGYDTMRLGAIAQREDLRALFERYVRREIDEAEQDCLEDIIDRVSGHTLALQLIARQVECSHISVKEAAALLKEKGFANIAPEKVDYVKDQVLCYEKVSDIISMLFAAGHMEAGQKSILKALSLFPFSGVEMDVFSDMLALDTKDEINGLVREGWMQAEGRTLSIHPVVHAVIRQWEWTEECGQKFAVLANSISRQLKIEDKKGYEEKGGIEKRIRGNGVRENRISEKGIRENRVREKGIGENRVREKGIRENVVRGNGRQLQGTVNRGRLFWLRLAESVLDNSGKEECLKNRQEYYTLLFYTVVYMPLDREEYILEHAEKLLHGMSEREMIPEEGEGLLGLYSRMITVYEEQRNLEMAYSELKSVEKMVRKYGSNSLLGQYCLMLADYYDYVIEGDYYRGKHPVEVRKRLWAIDKAIYYLKKEKTDEGRFYYNRALLTKAHLLIIAYPVWHKKMLKLFDAVKTYIDGCSSMREDLGRSIEPAGRFHEPIGRSIETSLTRLDYDVVRGWYHTYMDGDYESMMRVMAEADEIARAIAYTDLSIIYLIVRPWSNMLCDFRRYDEAAEKLKEGIQICEKDEYRGVVPYIRKKVDLYACLLDVYYFDRNFEKCREVIGVIDEENRKNQDVGVVKRIAEDYRAEVFGDK